MKENDSLKNIRDIYELTDEEMLDILDYIHLHKEDVEKEYQEVLQSAEQNRKYWEERNRELMAKSYQQREVIRAKLSKWREQYHAEVPDSGGICGFQNTLPLYPRKGAF